MVSTCWVLGTFHFELMSRKNSNFNPLANHQNHWINKIWHFMLCYPQMRQFQWLKTQLGRVTKRTHHTDENKTAFCSRIETCGYNDFGGVCYSCMRSCCSRRAPWNHTAKTPGTSSRVTGSHSVHAGQSGLLAGAPQCKLRPVLVGTLGCRRVSSLL
jgi:hypothetical protein